MSPETLIIPTTKGPIENKFYHTPASTSIVIFLAGAGGGWMSPNGGRMYPSIIQKLRDFQISSLQLRYRHPAATEECAFDVLEVINYLKNEKNFEKIGIVGWSFGGAVVCQGAGRDETGAVKAAVTLATQSAGVEPIRRAKGVASLFIHGTLDTCLPVRCSEYTYKIAPEPKKIHIVDDHHGFAHVPREVENEVIQWLVKYLS